MNINKCFLFAALFSIALSYGVVDNVRCRSLQNEIDSLQQSLISLQQYPEGNAQRISEIQTQLTTYKQQLSRAGCY